MTTDFSVGDVVKLRSGGPELTVCDTGTRMADSAPMVDVRWFDGDDQICDASIPAICCELVRKVAIDVR